MKILKQTGTILFISFLGELASELVPFNIPSGVYGIVILFLALSLKIIKLEDIEKTADFLLLIMPILFIPAGVGLITVWDKLSQNLFKIGIAVVISVVVVMVATGKTAQFIINRKKDKKDDE